MCNFHLNSQIYTQCLHVNVSLPRFPLIYTFSKRLMNEPVTSGAVTITPIPHSTTTSSLPDPVNTYPFKGLASTAHDHNYENTTQSSSTNNPCPLCG